MHDISFHFLNMSKQVSNIGSTSASDSSRANAGSWASAYSITEGSNTIFEDNNNTPWIENQLPQSDDTKEELLPMDFFQILSELELHASSHPDPLLNIPYSEELLLDFNYSSDTNTHGEAEEERNSLDEIDLLHDEGIESLQNVDIHQSKEKQNLNEKQNLETKHDTTKYKAKKRSTEQRRRKRINDKIKTLQRLIPHSNKTDRASILDEAVKYIKSLQIQIEMMSRSSGQRQLLTSPYGPPTYMSIMMRPNVQLGVGQAYGAVQQIPQVSALVCPPQFLSPCSTSSFAPPLRNDAALQQLPPFSSNQ